MVIVVHNNISSVVYRIDVQDEINVQVGIFPRAGGNFSSKSIIVQTKIRPCKGDFFLKINNCADQNKTLHTNTNKRAGGNFSSKSIIVQTKIRQYRARGIFFSKLINVHARLFGTLEYLKDFFS